MMGNQYAKQSGEHLHLHIILEKKLLKYPYSYTFKIIAIRNQTANTLLSLA